MILLVLHKQASILELLRADGTLEDLPRMYNFVILQMFGRLESLLTATTFKGFRLVVGERMLPKISGSFEFFPANFASVVSVFVDP
jgi:hypothetical protein